MLFGNNIIYFLILLFQAQIIIVKKLGRPEKFSLEDVFLF